MEKKVKLLPRTREALERILSAHDFLRKLEEEVREKEEEVTTNGIKAWSSAKCEMQHPKLLKELEWLKSSLVGARVDVEELMKELPAIFLDEYGLNETHAQVSDEVVGGKKIFHYSSKFDINTAHANLVSGDFQPGRFRENFAGIATYWGDEKYFFRSDKKSSTPVIVARLNDNARVHEIDWHEYIEPTFDDCKEFFDEEDFNLLTTLESRSGSLMSMRCFLDVALGYDACKIKTHDPSDVFAVYNRGALTLSSSPISTLGEAVVPKLSSREEEKGSED